MWWFVFLLVFHLGADVNEDTGFKRSFNLDAGSYLIQIFNQNNTGHYSLAVGKSENVFISQDELSHRAEMNKLASLGKWNQELEDR